MPNETEVVIEKLKATCKKIERQEKEIKAFVNALKEEIKPAKEQQSLQGC